MFFEPYSEVFHVAIDVAIVLVLIESFAGEHAEANEPCVSILVPLEVSSHGFLPRWEGGFAVDWWALGGDNVECCLVLEQRIE